MAPTPASLAGSLALTPPSVLTLSYSRGPWVSERAQGRQRGGGGDTSRTQTQVSALCTTTRHLGVREEHPKDGGLQPRRCQPAHTSLFPLGLPADAQSLRRGPGRAPRPLDAVRPGAGMRVPVLCAGALGPREGRRLARGHKARAWCGGGTPVGVTPKPPDPFSSSSTPRCLGPDQKASATPLSAFRGSLGGGSPSVQRSGVQGGHSLRAGRAVRLLLPDLACAPSPPGR